MSRNLLLLSVALLMTGCASDSRLSTLQTAASQGVVLPGSHDGSAPKEPTVIPMPTAPLEAAVPCASLPPMFMTAGEALVWVDQVSKQYVECESRRRQLMDAWPR